MYMLLHAALPTHVLLRTASSAHAHASSPCLCCAANHSATHPAPARQLSSGSQPSSTNHPDAPAWVNEAVNTLQKLPASSDTSSSGVSIPAEEELDVTAALQKALNMPVTAVQGAKQAPAGSRGLILRLAVDSKSPTSWWLSKTTQALAASIT